MTAPGFLLGAVTSFISVLIALDRSQALNAIKADHPIKTELKSDIPRLRHRAALLNKAIFFSTVSAIATRYW